MRLAELKQSVEIPEGVTIAIDKNTVVAKGKFGEAKRTWSDLKINIKTEGTKVIVSAKDASKKQKRMVATMRSHIRNIIAGVKDNNEYKLKICASHFPIQVAMEGAVLVVKNFFGEKIPRKIELSKDVQLKIQGDKITITGADVEKVGEAASRIEQLCRITNKDRRAFQDGIFLIERNGKAI